MGIHKRQVTCDICNDTEVEKQYGTGFENWTIVQGIGAEAPVEGIPLDNINHEMYVCPKHRDVLSGFLDDLQEEAKL